MAGVFDSGGIQSQVLFPENIANNHKAYTIYEGVPLPKEWGNFAVSAQDLYMSVYQQGQLQGFTPQKSHNEAMIAVKKTHVLKGNKYVLPDPVYW